MRQAETHTFTPAHHVIPNIAYSEREQSNGPFVLFLAVVAVYLIAGLIGHDPWKQDETYIMGVVEQMWRTGDWIVPQVAGVPFMEKPPLYYWLAAAFSWLCAPWLAPHDGARLATGFFMVVTFVATHWTAERWWGRGQGMYAVLALLACLGLLQDGHTMMTDLAVLAGFAIATSGFALIREKPVVGGTLLGSGIGIAFLGKGFYGSTVIGVSALLLPAVFPAWRNRNYVRGLAIALLAAAPWLLIWPLALYQRSPSLFMEWFWQNNVGRFLGFSVPRLGAEHPPWFWTRTIPWFAFPALPLALLTLWRERSRIHESRIGVPLVLIATKLVVLGLAASARSNYAVSMLPQVALLAVPAATTLSSRLDRMLGWTALGLFGLLSASVWGVWAVMLLHGAPPTWTILVGRLPLDFVPHLEPGAVLMAMAVTIGAIASLWWLPKLTARALTSWAMGLTLLWTLGMTLWLPWLNAGMSYRDTFYSLKTALPPHYRCVANTGSTESERAMLQYYIGIETRIVDDPAAAKECDLWLLQGLASAPPRDIDPKRWVRIWEGARPGDLRERFWLFAATKRE